MTIYKIYSKYNIIPSLQQHMLRVAAVAKLICDNSKTPVEKENIINACLLHDMGNIIKFDLSFDPKLLKPRRKEYWEKIKQDFIDKYGQNERQASKIIAKECDVNERVVDLVGSTGFMKGKETLESNDINKMICLYSDMRVTPHGVVSIEDRFLEGIKRHFSNKGKTELDEDYHDKNSRSIKKMEEIIFAKSKITANDITNDKVEQLIDSPFLIKYSL